MRIDPFAAGLEVGWSQHVVPFRGTSGHSGLERERTAVGASSHRAGGHGHWSISKAADFAQPNAIVMVTGLLKSASYSWITFITSVVAPAGVPLGMVQEVSKVGVITSARAGTANGRRQNPGASQKDALSQRHRRSPGVAATPVGPIVSVTVPPCFDLHPTFA